MDFRKENTVEDLWADQKGKLENYEELKLEIMKN